MIPPWKNERLRLVYTRPEIKASLEIILSVFMVAGLLFLAIRPTLATIAGLQKKIEDQDAVSRRLDSKISQLIKAQQDLATYLNRIAEYESAVPDAHDRSGLAKRIEVLIKESGLAVNSLSFTGVPLLGREIGLTDERGGKAPQTEAGGKVAVFEGTFDLFGGSNQVFDFLTKLENMDRLVIISEVNLKKEDFRSETTNEVTAVVRAIGKLRGYYILTPQP